MNPQNANINKFDGGIIYLASWLVLLWAVI